MAAEMKPRLWAVDIYTHGRGNLELFFLVPVGIIVFKPKLRHVCRQTTSLVPGL